MGHSRSGNGKVGLLHLQVAEQTAAARHEAELAAASVAGLAFEDKLKLLTALQPEPLAALVGALHLPRSPPLQIEGTTTVWQECCRGRKQG